MYTVTFNIGVFIQPCIQSTASLTQQHNQPFLHLRNTSCCTGTSPLSTLQLTNNPVHTVATTPLPYQPILYIGSLKEVLIMSPSTGKRFTINSPQNCRSHLNPVHVANKIMLTVTFILYIVINNQLHCHQRSCALPQ